MVPGSEAEPMDAPLDRLHALTQKRKVARGVRSPSAEEQLPGLSPRVSAASRAARRGHPR